MNNTKTLAQQVPPRLEVKNCETHVNTIEDASGCKMLRTNAKCGKCGYEVWVFGVGDVNKKKALLYLRKGCPRGENNFYGDFAFLDAQRELAAKQASST